MYISFTSLVFIIVVYKLINELVDITVGDGVKRPSYAQIKATNDALLAKYGPSVFKSK